MVTEEESAEKRKARRSLRFNLSVYFILISFICILLLILVFALFLWRRGERDLENQKRQLVEQGQEMAKDLERGLRVERVVGGERDLLVRERTLLLMNIEGRLINAIPLLTNSQGKIVEPPNPPSRIPNPIPEELMVKDKVLVDEWELGQMGKVMVVGVPLNMPNSVYAALYLVKQVSELGSDTGIFYLYLVIASSVALLISLALGILFSRKISSPVRMLTLAAREIAQGDLYFQVDIEGNLEIAELSHTFNFMTKKIKEGIEKERNFVANVSHELRTPLTSIEGFSQALLDGVVEDEEQRRRYLRIINEESKRLVRVLRDLLTLSRLDAGEITLHPSRLQAIPFLEEIKERFLHQAQEKGVELVMEITEEPPEIEVDRDKLEQVIINLVDNAIKFTPSGGKVTLSASPASQGWVRFTIKDSGMGIPSEDLPKIFDRFFRVERSRATMFGGAGLGLSICKQLVEVMGGSIQAQSAQGLGTVFAVNLPPVPGETRGAEK